jgi:hypothetical protein
MKGMRPASFISPVSIPENFEVSMEEEMKSYDPIVNEPLSLN